jgi:hypothetical protein
MKLDKLGMHLTRDEKWTLKMKPSIVHSGKKSSSTIAEDEANVTEEDAKRNEAMGFNKSFVQTQK